MYYSTNIPNYYDNMYYSNDFRAPIGRRPMPIGNRFIGPGGFILPFALGFATAPLVLGPRPRPYPPFPPYYYNNYPIYY